MTEVLWFAAPYEKSRQTFLIVPVQGVAFAL